jgi:pSer/pThr/pTyr-binding forkhead associated (FHA) protein
VAKKTLVIDGSDPQHFALILESDTLRIGDTAAHPEGVVRDLRVVRIHCEVEVEDDREAVPVDQPGVIAPSVLRPGGDVRLTHARLSLGSAGQAAEPSAAETVVELPVASDAAAPIGPVPRRLKVIDGGDQGRSFKVPASGTVTVGKTGGQADIGLHDLYVAKVHCSLAVESGVVTVTHMDGQNGTLIDGQRIVRPHVLKPGCVLRVGNSHLRLESGPFPDEPAAKEVESRSGDSKVLRAPPPAPPRKSDDPLRELEGQALGPYQLGRLLGRGYTGAVYQAANTKTDQPAALKVLAAEFPATQAELDLFAREHKAVQQVRHPNLVTLLGVGRSGAHCWIARELVEGECAAAVVERIAEGEKPSWTRAARVAVHLARVLECLHQHRLVHGNITPRNVLLRETDRATKLADLRLAQAIEGSRLQQAVLEKKLLAELPFLAPEQAEPGGFVDDLADLYALGAVTYALLTGRPPATGKTPEEILDQIREGRVVRPGAYYKKVPAEFDRVVMKLLARHQEDRYPTAATLLADLEPLAQANEIKL